MLIPEFQPGTGRTRCVGIFRSGSFAVARHCQTEPIAQESADTLTKRRDLALKVGAPQRKPALAVAHICATQG